MTLQWVAVRVNLSALYEYESPSHERGCQRHINIRITKLILSTSIQMSAPCSRKNSCLCAKQKLFEKCTVEYA